MKPLIREIDNKYIEIIGHYDNPVLCAKLTLLADLYAVEHKEGYALFKVEDYDKLSFIDDKLEFAGDILPEPTLSDLTGTTWILNDTFDESNITPVTAGEGAFAINFTSSVDSYNEIAFYDYDDDGHMRWGVQYNDTTSPVAFWDSDYGSWDPTDDYRTITITGGSDATNAGLIAWLVLNATQVSVTDLTNTRWKIKETGITLSSDVFGVITYSSLPAYASGFNITGSYSRQAEDEPPIYSQFTKLTTKLTHKSNYYSTFLMIRNNDVDVDDISHYSTKTSTSSPYSYNLTAYPDYDYYDMYITITGGTDVTNSKLINWLENNATLQEIVVVNNLTGTKWLFNELISIGNGVGSFNINFTSRDEQFETINIGVNPQTGSSDWDLYYTSTKVAESSRFIDSSYRTIDITGGADVTNASLIAWLLQNATQVIISKKVLKLGNKIINKINNKKIKSFNGIDVMCGKTF